MPRKPTPTHLTSRPPRQRDQHHAKARQHDTHSRVWQVGGVLDARLEFKTAIVAGQETRETDEHLAERRVDIKVEVAVDVVGAELAEMRLYIS